MIPNEFHKEVDRAHKSLIFHRIVDVVLRIVTLGLYNYKNRVMQCRENYERAINKCSEYGELVAELRRVDQEDETLQIT